MKVVIIEDEPLMAEALQEEILKADPSIEIVAQLNSIQSSIAYLNESGFPDLFFSDIELTDGLSFEIFKQVENTSPIIFCTAYNHYALEAFKMHSIDYILKPFDADDIAATIAKYKSLFQASNAINTDLSKVFQILENRAQESSGSILVHQADKIIPISRANIALIQLSNGVVHIHTFDRQQFVVGQSMDKLQEQLGASFYRVNRQFIIQRKAVKHVAQYFARKLIIQPSFDFTEPLIVSKANATHFLRWLESQ